MTNATASVAQNATAASSAPLASPLNLSTLISLLLSFSALRDWLKLIVIGGVIETCRRTCLRLWSSFIESFWITASFDENDPSYSETFFLTGSLGSWILKERRRLDYALVIQAPQMA